jgi:PmbA protein
MKGSSCFAKNSNEMQELADLVLQRAKSRGADSAEVNIDLSNSLDVTAYSGKLENIEHSNEQSISIRVYKGSKSGAVDSTELLPSNIDSLVDKAITIAGYTEVDEYAALLEKSYIAYEHPDLDLFHPSDILIEDVVATMSAMDQVCCSFDPRILNTESVTWSRLYNLSLYANTNGFSGCYPYSRYSLNCAVMAKDSSGKQCDGEYTIDCQHQRMMDHIVLAKMAAQKTCRSLSSRKISTRKCPIIFNPSCAKGLIGSLLRLVSGQMIYRESSFLAGQLGQQVASANISLSQKPHQLANLHSAPFDFEGGITKEFAIVEGGVLNSYLLSSYSARKLGMQPTGNAGGAYNVYVNCNDISLSQMLKNMGTGLMVTSLMGQGVNYITGDYSRGASGFWVENGEIAFPVDEITIAGNLREMFKSIQLLANDVDYRSNIKVGSILLDSMIVGGS